jgi:RNA polymerase sigma-70 factor (ECF subfamily)
VEAVTTHPFALARDDAHDRAREVAAVSRRRRFENLLDRHEGRLRRLALGMIGDPNSVDDVLQDAFVKVYRSLPARFESDGQESAWLYRVVHRTCLNELRARGRRREMPGFPEDAVADAIASEESLAVAAALAELPVDARAVILLVDLIGFDYETAAAALRVPRGTVASRLNTARGLLRAALEGSDA